MILLYVCIFNMMFSGGNLSCYIFVSYILQRKEVAKSIFAEDFYILKRWILTLFVRCALVPGACHITDSSLNSGRFCIFYLWGAAQHQVLKRNIKIFHTDHSFMQYWRFLMYTFFLALDHTKLINKINQ